MFLTINENTLDLSITTYIQALIIMLISNLSCAMPNWITPLKKNLSIQIVNGNLEGTGNKNAANLEQWYLTYMTYKNQKNFKFMKVLPTAHLKTR